MAESKLLWRLVNQSTLETLRGESRGQYDIRLGRHAAVDDFFDGLPRFLDHDGSVVKIETERVASADGHTEIPPYPLEIRRMGKGAKRAGEWYIRAQRPATAFPPWRPGSGPLDSTQPGADYVLLARTAENRFHGAWLRREDVERLPAELRAEMQRHEIGVAKIGGDVLASAVSPPSESTVDGEQQAAPEERDEVEQGIVEAPEGRARTVMHVRRERSRRLRAAKIAQAGGNPSCEACGFDFEQHYGERGKGFIECHHLLPVSDLDPGEPTRLDDLALLCANCHRMIHAKRPWLSVERLRALLS